MSTTGDERSALLEQGSVESGLEETITSTDTIKPRRLERTVGLLASACILFGNCVGAGIFISPRGVYEHTGSAGGGLLVWAFAGFIATLCTLAYAELGTMMQESGGEFVYIKNTYGKFPAFLFSFCNAFLIKPAAFTVGAATFADYFAKLIWGEKVTDIMVKSIGASVIVLLTVMNVVSSKLIIKFCGIVSVLKLMVVGFLLVCGVVIVIKGEGHMENFTARTAFENSSTNPTNYGLAFYFVAFSFTGWNSLNFMTEELKSPTTTLPRGGFLGVMSVTVSFILANISYLLLFSVTEIVNSKTIAMDSGYLAFGRVGELIMCFGLLISCLGCVGGGILCISRNIQSTAEDGLFPQWMAGISPTFNTPVPSILTLGGMCLAYLFVDAFALIPCLSTMEWFFYSVTFTCLLYLRYTEPKNLRPFKVPVVVGVFLLMITVTCVILPFFGDNRYIALLGFTSLPLGTIIYLLMSCYRKLYCPNSPPPSTKLESSAESVSSNENSFMYGSCSDIGTEAGKFVQQGLYQEPIVMKNG